MEEKIKHNAKQFRHNDDGNKARRLSAVLNVFHFLQKKKKQKTYFYINSHKKEFIILYKGIKYIVLVNNF